jgi:hemolysin D
MAFGSLTRHWLVWRAAWQAEPDQPKDSTREGRATEFLPAVLEVQQAPPSPIGRAILWTVMAVCSCAVLWAALGRLDVVATAQGKIIPSGYSKVIQPYESGVIRAIHVQDGQGVKQGDVLIELDPTQNRADHDRAYNEYRAAKVEAARLRALVAGEAPFDAPSDGDPPYILLQQELLREQLAEYHAKLGAARHLIDQRKAALEQTRDNIRRLEATVPMEAERANAYKTLLEHDAVTKMDFLQAEGQRIDKTQELAGQRNRLKQDQAALAEAQKNYRAMESEFQQTKHSELSLTDTKAASLAQDVTKAGQKADLQRLTAPIDGVAQQLAVHTVGGVVTPAQQLLIIVPKDHPVEVEAQVENKDVGFVMEGQPAEIKVETFPFTLYGTIPGRVLTLSDDAVAIEELGWVYPVRVSLERGAIQVEGKLVNLTPGMAVTVEIKTGQRRVIEYLLSPLLKSVHESLHER